MEERPSRVRSKDGSASRRGQAGKTSRCSTEDGGDPVECSGKSCVAGAIADCVAVCCCPLALVSLLALAFFKAPWMMGRRCLGLGKKNRQKQERRRKFEGSEGDSVEGMNENSVKAGAETGNWEIGFGTGLEAEEEQELWLDLYKLGHLGFGRFPSLEFSTKARAIRVESTQKFGCQFEL
ncbi:uncharacterized protein LOC127804647 [Diospyros lotus]|uniref:uncharacterized protein LOC127804647 n=1 Tax=Diospyros lotus TaxID=55363 RepID=UPI002250B9EF|nr:uncharacterized protein LOC127804647 [Diospyros lotus]XP_052197509.1 uncharacterized protein LOC127804647 [Diospyros lotus]